MRGHCPQCGQPIGVLKTLVVGDTRIRDIGCKACRYRPAQRQEYVPLQYAPRQPARNIRA